MFAFGGQKGERQTNTQNNQNAPDKGHGALPVDQATAIGSTSTTASMDKIRPSSLKTSLMFIAASRQEKRSILLVIDVVDIQNGVIPGDNDDRIALLDAGGASGMMISPSRMMTAMRMPLCR